MALITKHTKLQKNPLDIIAEGFFFINNLDVDTIESFQLAMEQWTNNYNINSANLKGPYCQLGDKTTTYAKSIINSKKINFTEANTLINKLMASCVWERKAQCGYDTDSLILLYFVKDYAIILAEITNRATIDGNNYVFYTYKNI